MNSAVYRGTIRHRRFDEPEYSFEYSLFMLYLDLDELDSVFEGIPGWSTSSPAPAWFRKNDHGVKDAEQVGDVIRGVVKEQIGRSPDGSIGLLTHLRYFGYCFNPVSFYYCMDEDDSLSALVPEVSNTPWGDMHRYVLDCDRANRSGDQLEFYFDKEFFVSPFMPRQVRYRMNVNQPGQSLRIHMDSYRDGDRFFDATLRLDREAISRHQLLGTLARTPAMTLKVTAAIYYEALKMWFNGAEYYSHPPGGKISSGSDHV